MKHVFSYLLVSMLFGVSTLTYSQEKSDFPSDWIGHWKGLLDLPGNKSIIMELIIEQQSDSDSLIWKIIYDSGKDVRDYRLIQADEHGFSWNMDERNGIVLHGGYSKNVFSYIFRVNSNLVSARYQRLSDGIHFEIWMYPSLPESRDSNLPGGVKLIETWTPALHQYAILKRQ